MRREMQENRMRGIVTRTVYYAAHGYSIHLFVWNQFSALITI